jgi:hypothetical protein
MDFALMVRMELLQNIYAVFGLILLLLLFLAVLVAACQENAANRSYRDFGVYSSSLARTMIGELSPVHSLRGQQGSVCVMAWLCKSSPLCV